MNLPLTQELLLIALDEETGKRKRTDTLDYGLAGAALTELVLLRRVDIIDKKVQVIDPSPTGDPVIDGILAELAQKPRSAKSFINKFRSGMSRKVGEQLAAANIVTQEHSKFLGLFPNDKFVERNGIPEREIRARLDSVVLQGAEPDERTGALATLIDATQLTKQAFPDVPKREIKPRLKELSESAWASDAVRRAIQDMQAAIITAVVVVNASS